MRPLTQRKETDMKPLILNAGRGTGRIPGITSHMALRIGNCFRASAGTMPDPVPAVAVPVAA